MNKKLTLIAALIAALVLTACAAFAEETAPAADYQVGDYVTFGTYEQDNNLENGQEPIEWRILEINGNEALAISRFILDAQPYDVLYRHSWWNICSLRPWLNNEFYNTAFTDEDKAKIITKEIENWKEANTCDPIFLLDNDQAKHLFANHPDRQCLPTDYAVARGSWESKKYGPGNGQWWLRTISWHSRRKASYIAGSGGVMTCGGESDGRVDNAKWGVRPAIYLDLNAFAK